MGQHHDLVFPNESLDYRVARDALFSEEITLRRQAEKVAALRRSLPAGGALKKDYVFQNLSGNDVRLSDLFSDKSPNLLIYSFMFKPGGDACRVCTSLLDGFNGSAPHIKQNLNFAVVAKASVQEIKSWADSRNWSNLNMLSSANTTYNLDYNAEDSAENQLMMMNVFRKSDDGIFHNWAYENMFMPKGDEPNPRQRDQIWPVWSLFDIALDDRPGDWFPAYKYD
jgi:predicted dithiol-disulfide oxidoreductase (DUF899 family)